VCVCVRERVCVCACMCVCVCVCVRVDKIRSTWEENPRDITPKTKVTGVKIMNRDGERFRERSPVYIHKIVILYSSTTSFEFAHTLVGEICIFTTDIQINK